MNYNFVSQWRKFWEMNYNFVSQWRKTGEIQFLENYIVWIFLEKKYGILEMQVSVCFFYRKLVLNFSRMLFRSRYFSLNILICGILLGSTPKYPNPEYPRPKYRTMSKILWDELQFCLTLPKIVWSELQFYLTVPKFLWGTPCVYPTFWNSRQFSVQRNFLWIFWLVVFYFVSTNLLKHQ